jgi:hypothetical protein
MRNDEQLYKSYFSQFLKRSIWPQKVTLLSIVLLNIGTQIWKGGKALQLFL